MVNSSSKMDLYFSMQCSDTSTTSKLPEFVFEQGNKDNSCVNNVVLLDNNGYTSFYNRGVQFVGGTVTLGSADEPKEIMLHPGSAIGRLYSSASFSGLKLLQPHSTASNGYDVLVNGGQKLILGSGEGVSKLYSTITDSLIDQGYTSTLANSLEGGAGEGIYLISDDKVEIRTNAPSGKTFTFDTAGNLTATKFTGDLVGTATRATGDKNGADITTNYVNISGAQTISGAKTFTNNINASGKTITADTFSGNATSATTATNVTNATAGYVNISTDAATTVKSGTTSRDTEIRAGSLITLNVTTSGTTTDTTNVNLSINGVSKTFYISKGSKCQNKQFVAGYWLVVYSGASWLTLVHP